MHRCSLEIDWKCCGYVRKLFGDDSQAVHKHTIHESMIWKMRFRTSDGILSLAIDCCNSVFIVADKYLIQIHHLAELAFSFLKHQKFPKSNEWARRYLDSRALAFFFIIKNASWTRHVITPLNLIRNHENEHFWGSLNPQIPGASRV